jgi:hypothetical protein
MFDFIFTVNKGHPRWNEIDVQRLVQNFLNILKRSRAYLYPVSISREISSKSLWDSLNYSCKFKGTRLSTAKI